MVTVYVYMQDGRVEEYEVEDSIKAREHAHRIINYGWRNSINGMMEYYPVHQVLKVKFKEPDDLMMKKYETKGAQNARTKSQRKT